MTLWQLQDVITVREPGVGGGGSITSFRAKATAALEMHKAASHHHQSQCEI